MKTNATLVLLGLSLTFLSHGKCDKKVDPNKVILFIDSNNSDLEIDTAEKAACSRGERLLIVPKNYKAYGPLMNELDRAIKVAKTCQASGKACEAETQKSKKAFDAFEAFKAAQTPITAATREALEEIKSKNGRLSSIVISGHDGGGIFSGTKGQISRAEISAILDEVTDINDVTSLLLLGCYTGVQKEVLEWKNLFPKIRMIGGYDASAPLADRPQGHQYLSGLLMKEKELISQADEKKLTNYTKSNLASMYGLNSAIFLRCEENTSEKDFYYTEKQKERGFFKLNQDECFKEGLLTDIEKTLLSYESGDIEPPKDTSNGDLRKLYNKGRAYEHCIELTESSLNMNTLFNLLFYDGVKKSFASYFKKDLADAEEALNKFSVDEILKNGNEQLDEEEKKIAEELKQLELLRSNPSQYLVQREKEYAEKLDAFNKFKTSFRFQPLARLLDLQGNIALPTGRFLSHSEMKLADEYKKLKFAEALDRKALADDRSNPSGAIQSKSSIIAQKQNDLKNHRFLLNELKNKPEELKSVWVPTGTNLSKKSRKELLTNSNKINKLMTLPGITPEQRGVLSKVNELTFRHLINFQNPFSWHEFNGISAESPGTVSDVDLSSGLGL